MSMIAVPAKLQSSGKIPTNQMLERAEAAGALAGLGECDPSDYNCLFGGGTTGGGTTSGGGTSSSGGTGAGWATLDSLLKMGLSIAGQAYLNNNQAKIATYGPNGTVLYQTSQIPSQYFRPENTAGVGVNVGGANANMTVSSTTLMMLVGGAVLVVALMASRRN